MIKNSIMENWLVSSQDEIMDKFASLPHAFADGSNSERFVYIPGTRDDRVLLVAHSDTVWNDKKIVVKYYNDTYYSAQENIGIGADDRAGCAILWYLRNLGHSLLITSGEEIGCKTSKWMMQNDWWKDEINKKHQFAIQFDRRGRTNVVFYDVSSKDFEKYILENTQYSREMGFGTDIKHLCKTLCGVNISVGYYREHNPSEVLLFSQWHHTLYIAQNLLKLQNIPRFEQFNYYGGNNYSYYDQHKHNYRIPTPVITQKQEIPKPPSVVPGLLAVSNEQIVCLECKMPSSEDDWYKNNFHCLSCGN